MEKYGKQGYCKGQADTIRDTVSELLVPRIHESRNIIPSYTLMCRPLLLPPGILILLRPLSRSRLCRARCAGLARLTLGLRILLVVLCCCGGSGARLGCGAARLLSLIRDLGNE